MADDWNNGLCDQVCGGDCGTCLAAWWCSPCLYGRTDQRLRQFPNNNTDSFSHCNSGCWIFCGSACFGLQWVVALLKRGEMRNHFGIKGDTVTDCALAFCCTPCALAQMETEVKDRAMRAGGNSGARDVKQSEYVSPAPQGGMQYGDGPKPAPIPDQQQYQQQQFQQQQYPPQQYPQQY